MNKHYLKSGSNSNILKPAISTKLLSILRNKGTLRFHILIIYYRMLQVYGDWRSSCLSILSKVLWLKHKLNLLKDILGGTPFIFKHTKTPFLIHLMHRQLPSCLYYASQGAFEKVWVIDMTCIWSQQIHKKQKFLSAIWWKDNTWFSAIIEFKFKV